MRILSQIALGISIVALMAACGSKTSKGSLCIESECASGTCFEGARCVSLSCQNTTCSGSLACVTFETGEERCVEREKLTSIGGEDSSVPQPDLSGEDTVQSSDLSSEETQQPDTSQPDTSQPDTSQPDTSLPDASQPDTSQPDTSQPDTSQPDTSQPDTGEPDQVDAATPPPLLSCAGLNSAVFVEGVSSTCKTTFTAGIPGYSVQILKDGNFGGATVAVTADPGVNPGEIEFGGSCEQETVGSVTLEITDGDGRTSTANCTPGCVQKLDENQPGNLTFGVGQVVGPLHVPLFGGYQALTVSVKTQFPGDSGLVVAGDGGNRRYSVSGTCTKAGTHSATVTVSDTAANCHQQSAEFTINVTCELPELSLSCGKPGDWVEEMPQTQTLVTYDGHWPGPPTSDSVLSLIPDPMVFSMGVISVDPVGDPNLSGSLDFGGRCHLPGTVSVSITAHSESGDPVTDGQNKPVKQTCDVTCKAQKIACPAWWNYPASVTSQSYDIAYRGVQFKRVTGVTQLTFEVFSVADTQYQTPLQGFTFSTNGTSPIYAATVPFPFSDPDFPTPATSDHGGTLSVTLDAGTAPAGDYIVRISSTSEDTKNNPGVDISDVSYCPLRVGPTRVECPTMAYGPFWKDSGISSQVKIHSNLGLFGSGDRLLLAAQYPANSISTPLGLLARNNSSTSTLNVFDISGQCDKSVGDFLLVFQHQYKDSQGTTVSELHYCKLGCTDGVVD